ncbi:hypothetical protein ANTHELSMS3_02726 [Antarctobacter heliothermus]|uniref:Uncharacterized protein n=1 Tax=Antarctobacter heliothermus TaxID=74033 RepID=A0A222E602_9RHOB|nr:hypothetical protein [Antarctobacter heliothermus]ASP21381.1 hypothetical protein ANTHELSMS3_02726 [Antarctobacter heliothermus]
MKKQLVAVLICALATSGCGKVMSFVGVEKAEKTAPAARPALTLSEPVRVAQPKTVAGGSWERNVARDIPYFNMSALPVAVYSDVEFTQKTGTLAPGEGGYIETCSDAKPVCKIASAGNTTGWVKMDRMGGVSN